MHIGFSNSGTTKGKANCRAQSRQNDPKGSLVTGEPWQSLWNKLSPSHLLTHSKIHTDVQNKKHTECELGNSFFDYSSSFHINQLENVHGFTRYLALWSFTLHVLTSLKGILFPEKPCQESLYHWSHLTVTMSQPFNEPRLLFLLHRYMEKASREKDETYYVVSLSICT